MKKILILMLISVIYISNIYSQTDSLKIQRKHSIGINAGFTTGGGITYRYMPSKYGFQISLMPIYEKWSNSSNGESISGLATLCLLNKIKSTKKMDFCLYEAQTYIKDNNSGLLNIGIGCLSDISLGYNMSISINLGLAYFTGIGSREFMSSDWLLLPDVGIGCFYKF